MVKKRILFIGYISSFRKEGVSQNTIRLINILEQQGHKCFVIPIGHDREKGVYGRSMLDLILKRKKVLDSINDFIFENKINYVQDVFVLPLSSLLITTLLIKRNPAVFFIKEILNIPGWSKEISLETVIRFFSNLKIYNNLIFTRFNKIITRDLFLSKLYKIDYVPTYVPIYAKKRTNSSKLRVCFLGHPLKKKGVDCLPGILSLVPKEYSNKLIFNFAFSDVGDDTSVRERIRKVANQKNIETNFYKIVEPHVFFRNNDVFVLPLADEFASISTPTSVIEAMEAGCVVLTSKLNTTSLIIDHGKNGILINRQDLDKWVDKLIYLIDNRSDLKRMSTNASRYVRITCSKQVFKRKLDLIYAQN